MFHPQNSDVCWKVMNMAKISFKAVSDCEEGKLERQFTDALQRKGN